MARVEGPLFSLEARGKVGNAIVFTPWKGRHCVRQWLKPTNPKSVTQGYVRCALKAISQWIKRIEATAKGNSADSLIYQACTASAPAGLNWNGYAGQGFLNLLQVGNTVNTASFEAIVDEYSSLASDVLTAFNTNGASLNIDGFTYGYGYTTAIPAGLVLYMGAKACFANGIVKTGKYTVDPASWAVTDVNAFKEDMVTA